MKNKVIEIDLLTLVGIILFVIGSLAGLIAFYYYSSDDCISNPVDYANNHSNNYGWDYVQPIYIGQISPQRLG